jgi:transposase
MITIGVDAHRQIHVAVAVDGAGRELAQWRGANRPDGWAALLAWAVALGSPRQWGVEGAWNYGRGVAQALVAAGEAVCDVNPRLTAQGRRRARQRDKTDRLDARAVARAVQQEERLPPVLPEDETAVLDLLVSERDAALAEATRLRNQAHHLLGQIDPTYRERLPTLTSQAGLRALEAYAVVGGGDLPQQRAAAIRRLAQRLRVLQAQVADLKAQVEARAQARFAPLTAIHGVNLLTAGALAGLLGPGQRFTTDAQLAAYAGVAPLEASSAGRVRHRLNRGGNRRLNAILYRIAMTQARRLPAARAYLDRRMAEGKTSREAMRALKRYIVRALWRQWKACQAQPPSAEARPAA